MPNYSNSKVYKLVNGIDSKIYVGSTTQALCVRLAKHKHDAKHNPSSVHRHFNTIGWDTVRIILIETVECVNKEQLTQREQHYIDLLKPSLNKRHAYVYCPHGRRHSYCKDCRGSQICEHDKQKEKCKICGGSQICAHNKQKSGCKDCKGSSICEHNRVKERCKICDGSQICEHNKRKETCKICSPKYCLVCDFTTSKNNYRSHTQTNKHIYNFINY